MTRGDVDKAIRDVCEELMYAFREESRGLHNLLSPQEISALANHHDQLDAMQYARIIATAVSPRVMRRFETEGMREHLPKLRRLARKG